MNRWTDLLASFGAAVLVHGLLVLGAVWFWTLRPPELRPVFQSGEVSLAVTFVAAEGDGRQTTEDGRQRTDTRQATDNGQRTVDSDSRKPETAEILTDTETEMPEEADAVVRPQPVAGMDSVTELLPDEGEDQDMPAAEAAAPVSALASAKAPEDGRQTTDDGRQRTDSAADAPSAAVHQGVSGAVRMQSEIRPYYPLGARLRGEEGAVTVRVWVNPSGRVSRSEVIHSSGFPALDEAAVDAARRARYVATRPGAWRAEAETTLTFRFKLTE